MSAHRHIRCLVHRAFPLLCSAALLVGAQAHAEASRYPTPTGHVNDFAGVIDHPTVQRLESALTGLEQRTGNEVAIVTLPNVPDGDVERAAVDLFREWGIGKKSQDNGVLILCSVQDRKVRIEVGYGLEAILPDAKAGQIIREQMVPYFRQGHMSQGLVNGTVAVITLLTRQADGISVLDTTMPNGISSNAEPPRDIFSWLLPFSFWCFVVSVVLIIVVAIVGRMGRQFVSTLAIRLPILVAIIGGRMLDHTNSPMAVGVYILALLWSIIWLVQHADEVDDGFSSGSSGRFGGGFGGGGGGFGGFGGGSSGGGGASGSW